MPPCPPILGGSEIQSPPGLAAIALGGFPDLKQVARDLGGLMDRNFKWIWDEVITVRSLIFKQSIWRFLLIVCMSLSLVIIPATWVHARAANHPAPKTTISRLEQLLKSAQNRHDRESAAKILSDLGIARYNLSQYPQAIELYKQAGKLFLELNQRRHLGQVLINLGNAHAAIGDYEQAQVAYESSLKIAQAQNDSHAQAVAFSSLGGIDANYGKDKSAIAHFEAALKIQQQLGDRLGEAYSLLNLGSIHHVLRNFDVAIRYSQAAYKLAQTLKDSTIAAASLTNLALIDEYKKDYTQSIVYHQQALAIAQPLQQPQLIAQVLNNYGYTLWQMGDLEAAATTVRQAIQTWETMRSGLQDDADKISLLDTKRFSYQLLQQILIAQNQPEVALAISEQGRSRAFAERLIQGQNQTLQPITIPQIQQVAKTHNATLVEYSLVPDRAFRFRGKQQGKAASLMIWVVQPNGKITFRQVDLQSRWEQQGDIRKIVRVARCLKPIPTCPALNQNDAQTLNPIAALNYPGLPELHEILIAPIADLLPHKPDDSIIFIPQDALFLVPFAALPNPQGEAFIQHHTIATAPSIQVLNLTRQNDHQPWQADQILVGGNPHPMPLNLAPLPHAEREAISISQSFQTQPLLGESLTRSQLLSRLPQAKLIHLATHGLLEHGSMNPLDLPGAIALAQTSQDNGLLTAMEIAKLKLKADLVVLSACDTGRGAISGDGVLGLSRSWMTAGASNVLVSLWAVSDESTAYLMEQFYNALTNQPNYAIALRQAMLKTMEKYPSPYDWSAFTLMGG
jgi:CHAT domain-containing protein/Tfp pilus assembly protein PilF